MPTNERRDVVAVLTDAFAPFHRVVVDALVPHFERHGLGTVAVIGREVSSDRLRDRASTDREQLRSLGSRLNVRGAVIVSGAMPPSLGEFEIAQFVDDLTDGPVVSFGIEVPGLPSSKIRWQEAISDLVAHMTSDPRRRRFVFVRGYQGDPHSAQREAGFRVGMANAGLDVDEALVVRGNYNTSDALSAVSALIRRGHRFDGIIAANDDMAVGAIAALTKHGLSVPDDVIVSGFDDSLAAFDSVPPLTTAMLDTDELARATAGLITDALHEGRVLAADLRVEIPSRLVVRESSTTYDSVPVRAPDTDRRDWLRAQLIDRWEVDRVVGDVNVDELADAIVTTALDGCHTLDGVVAAALEGSTVDDAAIAWWRHVLSSIRWLLVDCAPDAATPDGLRAVMEQLETIDRRLRPAETQAKAEMASKRDFLQRLTMHLAACADVEELWETLRTGLTELGFERAWVATDDPDEPGRVRLQFSLDRRRLPARSTFSSADLLPDRWADDLERHVNVLVPLRAGAENLGYMIIDPSDIDLLGLTSIASEIAQVMRHADQMAILENRADELHEANRALDALARIDTLTGLPNRKSLFERLDAALAERTDDEVAVLFFDLDGFKAVNDTLGHAAGDEMLQQIGERVSTLIGSKDTFARLGGDEFTIVVRQVAGSDRATSIADALRATIATPFELNDGVGRVSASIGFATAPDDGTTSNELMRHADEAMYEAKTGGKNTVVRFRSRGRQRAGAPS